MPTLGFGKKQESQSFTTDIADKKDLEEIKKIRHTLNPNEEVFVVARQSRLKPGGSAFTHTGRAQIHLNILNQQLPTFVNSTS